MKRIVSALFIVVVAAAVPLLSSGGASSAGPKPSLAADTVSIVASGGSCASEYCYTPANLTISQGQTVTWVNNTAVAHTVTSCTAALCSGVGPGTGTDPAFTSGGINPTATFALTFHGPGTYNYYCQFHGYSVMHGTITVMPSVSITTTSLPPATVGSAYSASLSATGGSSPYTYSITSSSPPSWLNLDPSTGALTGTPTTSGVSNVTFEVTDTNLLTGLVTLALTVLDQPGAYVPLAPVRICDTRPGNPSSLSGAAAQCNGMTLGAGGSISFGLAGSFGVPSSNVTAVVLNVTEANTSGNGFFTLYPTGSSRPTASSLNFSAGQVVPNLVEVGVGSGGSVSLYSATHADAIVDLEGYVTTASQGGAGLYNALSTPARICDTRGGNPSHLTGGATQCNTDTASGSPSNLVTPTAPLTVTVTGNGGVPATGVEAAVLNVTVVGTEGPGFVTAYPTGTTQPTASNVNFATGQVVANRVIVPVSSAGQVTFFAAAPTNLVVDVSGFFTASGGTGAEFTPEPSPVRICDTRGSNPSGLVAPNTQCNTNTAHGSPANPIGQAASRTVQSTGLGFVPTGAVAAVLNVTAVSPTASGFLTVYPSGTPPTTSDVNCPAGGVLANLVVATLTGSGSFDVYNAAGNTNVVVDVAGWYTTPA